MQPEYRHNCILNAAVTEAFADAFGTQVGALVKERFGAAAIGVIMYDHHLDDGFLTDGVMHYPLTVALRDRYETMWVSWPVTEGFAPDNPYGYLGTAPLSVTAPDTPPAAMADALRGRRTHAVSGALPIYVETEGFAVMQLVGKLSQSFIDTMAGALTALIEQREGVSGLAASGLELHLVFARDTFMEHTSERVTYRRLVLTDGGRTRRDLWVLWERLSGEGAYTVADTPDAASIRFALGEDVSQTVRQKEYRYLLKNENNNTEAYTRAMGRRNVSEWRELIKKAVKRGLLTVMRTEDGVTDSDLAAREAEALASRLSQVMTEARPEARPEPQTAEDDVLSAALRRALSGVMDGTTDTSAPDLSSPFATDTVHTEAQAAEPAPFVLEETGPEVCETAEADTPAEELETVVFAPPTENSPLTLDLSSPFATDTVHTEAVAMSVPTVLVNEDGAEELWREPSSDGLPLSAQPTDKEEEDISVGVSTASSVSIGEELYADAQALVRERLVLEAERRVAEDTAREHAERIARLTEEQEQRAMEIRRLTEERQRKEAEAARENEQRVAEEKERLRRLEEELLRREAGMRERITDDVKRTFAEREKARMEEEARLALEAEARKRAKEEALEAERRLLEEARAALEAERIKTAEVAAQIRRAEEARLAEEQRLREEAERRAEEARLAEEQRLREAEARRLEEERLREEARRLEAARAEEARLAALKRQAEEELRLANERHEAELRRLSEERARIGEEEARLSAEREREEAEHRRRLAEQEEALRAAAARRAEEEERRRMAAEQAQRAEQTRLRMQAEEQRLREQTQRTLDEAAARRAPDIATDDEESKIVYTFTSYLVRLQFERAVDPNIHARLRTLIENTVQYFKKEDVPISVRSAMSEGNAVNLHFYRIPREEYDLLIHIVKVLGNSGLGIKKITLEEQRV